MIPPQGRILDYGCGYGRTCVELVKNGYRNVTGVDISSEMIRHGLSSHPALDLHHIGDGILPFEDNTFSACILMAVLTCIPTDTGQKKIIRELHRVLKPEGILYASDYPLQQDKRNNERYRRFEAEYKHYGVFRLSDGGVFRHHAMSRVYRLFSRFGILRENRIKVLTMNGNNAEIFQIFAQKRG